jgi:hypothetical protein
VQQQGQEHECGVCLAAMVWDPDDPTGQQPHWRHVDQTAAVAFGSHRATLALEACASCGHDAPHRRDTGCPQDNGRAELCRCTARVDVARAPAAAGSLT